VVSSAPTGPIASAIVVRADGSLENRVVEGSVIDFRVKAMDAAFNGVPVSGLGASWWVEGPGAIDATGRFRATGLGTATIVAQAGFVQARRMLTIVPDDIPPVAKAPIYRFDVGAQVTPDAAPIEVRWASASDVGSGVVSHGLRTSRDGSPWTDLELPSPTTRSIDLTVRPGSSQRFAVNATDAVGNVGEYAATSSFRVRLLSETGGGTRYTGSWRYVTGGDDLGSRYRYATRAGARVRVTATGSQFAWIAPVGPTFGSARVYVDGRNRQPVRGRGERAPDRLGAGLVDEPEADDRDPRRRDPRPPGRRDRRRPRHRPTATRSRPARRGRCRSLRLERRHGHLAHPEQDERHDRGPR
jgi:hypothetical protein